MSTHSWQIQVQQDEIRAGSVRVFPFTFEEGNSFHAVGSHMQNDGFIGSAKGFLGQPDITGIVFDQQERFDSLFGHPACLCCGSFTFVSQKSLMLRTSASNASKSTGLFREQLAWSS